MAEDSDETNERHWINGHRAAWRGLLGQAIRELRGDGVEAEDPELRAAVLLAQLEDVRAALRRVCEDHGDNDWPDNLHLGDVIEKHLGRHLDQASHDRSDGGPK